MSLSTRFSHEPLQKPSAKTRTICKQMNEETHTSRLVGNLHHRTNTVLGFFVQSLMKMNYKTKFVSAFPSSKELSLSFLPPTQCLRIMAATKQGLLLCVGEFCPRAYYFFICKPATEQWVRIPRPKTRYLSRSYAVAVMSSNPRDFRYKIARFSEPKNPLRWRKRNKSDERDGGSFLRCEIFDSAKWAWRELPGPVRLRLYESLEPNSRGSMVTVSGAAYALTTEGRVLSLDWAAETWEVLDSPAPLLCGGGIVRGHLVDCGGRLGLMVDPELWVSENGRVWNLRSRVNLKEVCGYGSFARPLSMVCSDIGMAIDFDKMIFFRFGISKPEIVKVSESVFQSHLDWFFKIESDEEFVDLRPVKVNRDLSTPSSSLVVMKKFAFILLFFVGLLFMLLYFR